MWLDRGSSFRLRPYLGILHLTSVLKVVIGSLSLLPNVSSTWATETGNVWSISPTASVLLTDVHPPVGSFVMVIAAMSCIRPMDGICLSYPPFIVT